MEEIETEYGLTSILRYSERVCVLFYSSWCRFSRAFLPIFEKYNDEEGSVKFLRIRLDDQKNPLWKKYSVQGVPTVILFKRERVVKRLDPILGVGLNENQLKYFLKTEDG